ASVLSEAPLEAARGAALGEPVLREKLGALGGTRWELGRLDVALEGAVAISPAELKRVRRRLVEALEAQPGRRAGHEVRRAGAGATVVAAPGENAAKNSSVPVLSEVEGSLEIVPNTNQTAQGPAASISLVPLCRT